MASAPDRKSAIIAPAAGLLTGLVFAFVFGEIDPASFVVEELSMGPVEIPFIVLAALLTARYGWKAGLVFSGFGILGTWAMDAPGFSATVPLFAKNALTGLVIGTRELQSGRFALRFTAASAPGAVLACVYGLPIVIRGVPSETLEDIRKEAEGMYRSFMSPEDARNASENASLVMKEMFKAGFAVFFLNALLIAWFSFIVFAWVERRLKRDTETVPPFRTFALPFHTIWVFLASFALVLSEYGPTFPIALNICLATAFLYGVQGTAIVFHYMNRASVGRFPRVLFWLMFFITIGFTGFFLALIGMIDNWYSLRPPVPTPDPGGGREETDHEGDSQGRRER